MADLIRLSYASKTTSSTAGVQRDLLDILQQARHFNARQQIHGVLFYDNNYFFQCLEGERKAVLKLYHKITRDPRHTDIVQLSCEKIEKPAFQHWQMKYILEDSRIRHFFAQHYGQSFNPYLLQDASEPQLKHAFIQLLRDGQETEVAAEAMSQPASPTPLTPGYKPIYSSGFFTLFVVIPLIVFCLMIYLS